MPDLTRCTRRERKQSTALPRPPTVAETGRPGGKGQRPVAREGYKKRQEVDPAWPPVGARNAA